MNKSQIFLLISMFLCFLGNSWAAHWEIVKMLWIGGCVTAALCVLWPITWDDLDL